MGILAINLIKLRGWAGITQNQLAERLDVGATTINNIETGYVTSPPLKFLEEIANLFKTTVDGLMGRKPLDVGERARLIYVVSSIDSKTAIVEAEKIVDGVFMDRDKLRGYDWFGLRINDNALSGKGIHAGYTAIVRVGAKVRNGDVVVASVEGRGEAVVRIYHKKDNIVTLRAVNESGLYKDIVINTEENYFKLIGKVEKCEFEL